MGILNALFGGYGRNDDDDDEADIFFDKRTCTRCGSTMQGDGCRFECPECGVLFLEGLRVKMCVWLGVSRGLDLAFLNAD